MGQTDLELTDAKRLQRENELILRSAGEGIMGLDEAGRITFVNPAAAEMVGWHVDELIGRSHHGAVHHSHADGTPYGTDECLIHATIEDGIAYSVSDELFWRKDGTSLPVQYTSTPIVEGSHVLGAVLVFRDITERQEAQQTMHRYAERLRALRAADQAILAASSMEETANAALRHLQNLIPFSWAAVDLFDAEHPVEAVTLLTVHPADAADRRRARIRRFEREGLVQDLSAGRVHVAQDGWSPESEPEEMGTCISVPLRARQRLIGSLNLCLAHANALTEEETEIAREISDELAIGIEQARLHDRIRDHARELERQVRRRTAALRASQARFEAVFEEAAIGIALLNQQGEILASNPALHEMLGYGTADLTGRVLADLAHPDDAAADADLYRALIDEETRDYRVDKRYMHRDGSVIYAHLTISLVRHGQEASRFAIAMIEDITERKRAQEALIESEKLALTGELAASLAHEINNPLQSVIGCLALAQEVLAEGGSVGQYVEIAIAELERTARIVGRLRDLNRRSDSDGKEPTDVNALLTHVLALSHKQCETKGVAVHWERDETLPPIPLIPDRIPQVFLNLILNAIDAMPDGGDLEVRTQRTEEVDGIRIAFADTGVGIPQQTLPHIFEPFRSLRPGGLGLGLHVSRNIVDAHGGWIDVESQEGVGSTFTVWLPA
jgi:PAS domain S-box-containing protein